MGYSKNIKPGTPWSKAEVGFLKKYYGSFDTRWISRELGRTVQSVRQKANRENMVKDYVGAGQGRYGATNAFAKFRGKKR